MINRNRIIRQADRDGVPAPTVERDYILTHVLAAISGRDLASQLAFKGGTALRLCYFETYRYSADLDFSLIDGLDRTRALRVVDGALSDCRGTLRLPDLGLTDAIPERIKYVGPLGRSRTIKLDLAADELVEEASDRPMLLRYED